MSGGRGHIRSVSKIVDNGSNRDRWDLVIMGDGYRADEIAKFEQDARGVSDAVFATAPFDALQSGINVHRVNVVSDESGAGDYCAGVDRATFFDANFCAGNIRRLLVVDPERAMNVALDAVPQMNATLVIVNSTTYGGSGGSIPVFSMAEGAFEIALHEMGHSHFGLADEYPFLRNCSEPDFRRFRGAEPPQPNISARLDQLKWANLIARETPLPTTANRNCDECDGQPNPVGDDVIGAFEGAYHYRCGIFRPQYDCRMRTLGVPFCAVCQRTIRNVLEPYVPGGKRRAVRH